jgi:hypothetical protein
MIQKRETIELLNKARIKNKKKKNKFQVTNYETSLFLVSGNDFCK